MGRLSARLLYHLRTWDRSSQFALALALPLLLIVLFVGAFGPANWQQPAVIGLAGLVVMIQFIVLWGNRGMVTPLTRAQRQFVAGEFEVARDILEELRASGKANTQALTLLGNTYRQMSLLEESETVLREVLALRPNDYFPLIGFGRTLLATGDYGRAAQTIETALAAGAPSVICVDLGEIYYRLGRGDEAQETLQAVRPTVDEPYRALMIEFLLFRLNVADQPSRDILNEGLAYWAAAATRFRHTPYGEALAADVLTMQTLLEE